MSKSFFGNSDDDDWGEFLESSERAQNKPFLGESVNFNETPAFTQSELSESTIQQPTVVRTTESQNSSFFTQNANSGPPSGTLLDVPENISPVKTKNGKTPVLLFRWLIILIGLGLVASAIMNIVSPPQFPGPDQVINRVKEGLEITEFPKNRADGFVLSFIEVYAKQDSSKENKLKDLELFYHDGSSTSGFNYNSNINIDIISGPHITGVEYHNDNVVTYSTILQVSTGEWMNLSVPVLYNNQTDSFAILEAPSLIPLPSLADQPAKDTLGAASFVLSASAISSVVNFFNAWGTGDQGGLDVTVDNEASVATRNGFKPTENIKLVNVNSLLVYDNAEANGQYQAVARVTWEREWELDVSTDKPVYDSSGQRITKMQVKTTFNSNYQLVLEQKPNQKWFVKDIKPEEFLIIKE